MEYIVFIVAAVAFVIFVFVKGYLEEKRQEQFFARKQQDMEGKIPKKEYKVERFLRIPGYFEKHTESFQIDDITWNDLGMDDIFIRMNYAVSSTGEEYLYYMLRTPLFEEERLKHFDDIVEYYRTHTKQRVQYQCLMHKLGSTGKYSLYDYLDYLTRLGKRSNARDFTSLLILLALVGVCFFQLTIGVLGVVAWMLYQMFSYFKIKKEIEPYTTSLAYIMRLISVSDKVLKIVPPMCEEEKTAMQQARRSLNKSRQGSFWIFNSGSGKTGDPLDAIFDYVRMITHVDLIYFNRMLGEITNHMDALDALISGLGYLESAVCVALYRASLKEGWCKPKLQGEVLKLKEGYHPLIEKPVKNSIIAEGGVLLTGSNASGKSTFLKMVALNALTAQTIYTAAAEEYTAPLYYLYSSMSLRDDLESGDSYYIVEIKSIKRILDSRKLNRGKILCFVDEVLRGTNTVERIAASTQILFSMTGQDIQCFAATHDIELTQLLSDVYENYHFEEEIKDGDVLFNYQLQPGKATTRNAIKLLEIMGYEKKIIEDAQKQADVFLKSGVWNRP